MKKSDAIEQKTICGPNAKSKKVANNRLGGLQKDEIWLICLVIIPQIILTCILYLYVNFDSLTLAFRNARNEWTTNTLRYAWDELTNFDSDLGVGIVNTLMFFIKNILMLFFQLFIAYFFYKKMKGTRVFQIILYLPTIIGSVATVSVFKYIIEPRGPIGEMLGFAGMEMPHFLGKNGFEKFLFTSKASWTILVYSVWVGWGADMLLFGGAFARIPVELLEAAKLDGINAMEEIVYLIFPLIWPTFSTLLILNLTNVLNAGGPVLLFDKYGTMDTWTVGYVMFYKVMMTKEYNLVSAMGLYLTIIIVPLVMGARKLIEKIPTVEY